MNAKLRVDLSKSNFCEKPGCKGPRHHRHHKGHQFLFVPRWEGDPDPEKMQWVMDYLRFRPEDLVGLCPRHHAEIHVLYDRIIIADNRRLMKPLDAYTYKQACKLRDKLISVCDEWMKQVTPGTEPHRIFGRARTRAQLRAKERKHGGEENKDKNSRLHHDGGVSGDEGASVED